MFIVENNQKTYFIYTLSLNYADYVELKTNFTDDGYFLVDSQADISVIKLSSLIGNFSLDKSEIVEIRGVTEEPIHSLGFIMVEIFIDNMKITHKFHIMPNNFHIPSDGILGKDFCKLYECVLDYGEHTFKIRTRLGDLTIPMHLYTKGNEIVLPARSEVTRIFRISVDKPSLITSQEIAPGIFTSNVIVQESGDVPINIVNTTNETKSLKYRILN